MLVPLFELYELHCFNAKEHFCHPIKAVSDTVIKNIWTRPKPMKVDFAKHRV